MDIKEKLQRLYGNPIFFENGEEMARDVIECAFDLYCPEIETYVFCYNACGSIAVYDCGEEEVERLVSDQINGGDYWGAYLGMGGYIYDSDTYEKGFTEGVSLYGANRAWIESHFAAGGWYYVNQIEFPENIRPEDDKARKI